MPSLSAKRHNELSKLKLLRPSEDDPHPTRHGVLLSDEIRYYVNHHNLITPFDLENLKPAAYELTIGNEYFLNGEYHLLDANSNDSGTIQIPPFEVAILKTVEILCLPRYIIGRWNIKVRHAYSGLLWVGGPQVDPGWVGHLSCPIYNLSDKPVTLHIGDQIAVIDFVKTTPFDVTKSPDELLRYPFPPKRVILEDYGIDDLRSALFTTAGRKLAEFEGEIKRFDARFTAFTQLSFLVLALVVSAIAIISKVNSDNLLLSTALWGSLNFALSVFAVLMVLLSTVQRWVQPLIYELYGGSSGRFAEHAIRLLRRRWWSGLILVIALSAMLTLVFYHLAAPYLRALRHDHVLTEPDLQRINISTSQKLDKLISRIDRLEDRNAVSTEELRRLEAQLQRIEPTTNKRRTTK